MGVECVGLRVSYDLRDALAALAGRGYDGAIAPKSKLVAIFAALVFSWLPATAQDSGERCSDRRISASAVRTLNDIQAFVECAKRYLDENGPAEALRAFNEEGLWKHGSIYVFVV